jgi:DNA-binding NarL/FixJ family response regulator
VSEVATELRLTPSEVRAALAGAMRTLGAGSKLEAVILALRRGDIVT